jgi:hypothetical protein
MRHLRQRSVQEAAPERRPRRRHRRLEKREVAHSRRPAVPLDLIRVEGEYLVEGEEGRLPHSASLLNAPA